MEANNSRLEQEHLKQMVRYVVAYELLAQPQARAADPERQLGWCGVNPIKPPSSNELRKVPEDWPGPTGTAHCARTHRDEISRNVPSHCESCGVA